MQDDEITKLERHACRERCFDTEDRELLKEVIRVYRGWQFLIKVVKGGTVLLGISAATIVAWSSIGEAIKTWVS